MTTRLVIDTSTSRTIVGIVNGAEVLFEKFHDGATDHGRAIGELVQEALKEIPAIDEVIVGMGPGPFTGLRVGISFARSFALARQIPIIGVCSLDAIIVDQSEYIVAVDARRKEIYWARYKDGIRIEGPAVNKPSEVDGFITDVFPSVEKLVSCAKSQNITEPIYLRRPDAVATADRA